VAVRVAVERHEEPRVDADDAVLPVHGGRVDDAVEVVVVAGDEGGAVGGADGGAEFGARLTGEEHLLRRPLSGGRAGGEEEEHAEDERGAGRGTGTHTAGW